MPPASLLARLTLTRHVAERVDAAGSATIEWSFPSLPDEIVEAVEEEWGVAIGSSPDAASPLGHPSAAALLAHARSEQIVRALSSRTNLVLPGSRAVVVGAGPLADVIAGTLSRLGGRVIRATDDPVTRLRAHLAGWAAVEARDGGAWPVADFILATGEGHAPLDPARVPAVAIDASLSQTGIAATSGALVRPHVRQLDDAHRIVEPPRVLPDRLDGATALEWRIVDVVVALSLLVARGASEVDPRLALAANA